MNIRQRERAVLPGDEGSRIRGEGDEGLLPDFIDPFPETRQPTPSEAVDDALNQGLLRDRLFGIPIDPFPETESPEGSRGGGLFEDFGGLSPIGTASAGSSRNRDGGRGRATADELENALSRAVEGVESTLNDLGSRLQNIEQNTRGEQRVVVDAQSNTRAQEESRDIFESRRDIGNEREAGANR